MGLSKTRAHTHITQKPMIYHHYSCQQCPFLWGNSTMFRQNMTFTQPSSMRRRLQRQVAVARFDRCHASPAPSSPGARSESQDLVVAKRRFFNGETLGLKKGNT